MKVYILYSNPYDEGDSVYGVFSSEEKVNKALEIFSPLNEHELYFREMELDELEKYYEKALSGYWLWIGNKPRHYLWKPVTYGDWGFYPAGLDSLFEDDRKDYVLEMDTYVSARITAKSKEEAEEIANKIFEEKGEGYNIYLVRENPSK